MRPVNWRSEYRKYDLEVPLRFRDRVVNNLGVNTEVLSQSHIFETQTAD
jgi:hypothetical protein